MNKNLKSIAKFILKPEAVYQENKIHFKEKFTKEISQTDFFFPINNHSENDIFIVGYPKSGNTWMQSIAAGLQYGIDTTLLSDKLAQEIVPDVHARKFYKRFGNFNFFKSHHLPQKDYKRVIYIVREGKDAMVSYYFYLNKLGNNITLEEMINEKKGIFPSSWSEHVKAWKDNPYKSEILYIRYEDLLNNPIPELKKICEFSNLERAEDLLEKVIKGNSFENMQKKAQTFGGLGHVNWQGDKGVDFFRNGKIGDYKNHMTKDLIEKFNTVSIEQLKLFSYI